MSGMQTFHYDYQTKHWENDITKNILSFDWDHWLANDNVYTIGLDKLKDNQNGVKWDIHYCKGWNPPEPPKPLV